jgi:hypothetical protein
VAAHSGAPVDQMSFFYEGGFARRPSTFLRFDLLDTDMLDVELVGLRLSGCAFFHSLRFLVRTQIQVIFAPKL